MHICAKYVTFFGGRIRPPDRSLLNISVFKTTMLWNSSSVLPVPPLPYTPHPRMNELPACCLKEHCDANRWHGRAMLPAPPAGDGTGRFSLASVARWVGAVAMATATMATRAC